MKIHISKLQLHFSFANWSIVIYGKRSFNQNLSACFRKDALTMSISCLKSHHVALMPFMSVLACPYTQRSIFFYISPVMGISQPRLTVSTLGTVRPQLLGNTSTHFLQPWTRSSFMPRAALTPPSFKTGFLVQQNSTRCCHPSHTSSSKLHEGPSQGQHDS